LSTIIYFKIKKLQLLAKHNQNYIRVEEKRATRCTAKSFWKQNQSS